MNLPEIRKGNLVAVIAVSLTALSIALTILVRTVVEVSGTKERVVALEKAYVQQQKEIEVIQEDYKRLLRRE